MKRTIIALATVIAASLTAVDIVFPKSAASQVSSSLVGYWGSGAGGVGDQQIHFFPDGSYKLIKLVKGTGVHSYNIYGRTIEVGNFEVGGNTIVLYPQTRVKKDAIGKTYESYSFPKGTSLYYSATLQNGGQTLVMQDAGGRLPLTRINQIFAQ